MNKLPYLLILLLILSGCTSLRTPEIKGIVVDAETGKPINEARVYAEWKKVDGSPGGRISGGVVKELRLKTGQDGRFKIPSYLVINYLPYPLGQGGNFCIVVYAHGYKLERYNIHDPDNFDSGIGDVKNGNLYTFKMIGIHDSRTFQINESDLAEADLKYLLDEKKLFVKMFPTNEKVLNYLLGIASIYEELKEYDKAIDQYKLICNLYAESDACKEATVSIEKINNIKGARNAQ